MREREEELINSGFTPFSRGEEGRPDLLLSLVERKEDRS